MQWVWSAYEIHCFYRDRALCYLHLLTVTLTVSLLFVLIHRSFLPNLKMSNEKTAQPLRNDYPAGLSAPPPADGTPGVHGYQPQPAVMGQGFADQSPPPDYLVLSIITILCCFWPLGLVGLIKSVEAKTNYQNGQFALAHAAARDAKRYNIYGIVIGVIALGIVLAITIISVIIVVVTAAAAAAAAN